MWSVIVTFVAAAAIIYLSYLASRYIGRNVGKSASSRYMRLIDQITVGQDRHIAIVQVGGKYMLVGITSGQINVLTEVGDEDLFPLSPDSDDSSGSRPDFKALMGKLGDMAKRGR